MHSRCERDLLPLLQLSAIPWGSSQLSARQWTFFVLLTAWHVASFEPRDIWRHLNHVTCYVMILLVARIHVVQSARDAILCNITVIDYSRLVLLIVGVFFYAFLWLNSLLPCLHCLQYLMQHLYPESNQTLVPGKASIYIYIYIWMTK